MSEDDGKKLAKEQDVPFFETSAKTGANVKSLFQKVASLLPGLEGADIAADAEGAFDRANC